MPIYEYYCNDCSNEFEELIIRKSDADDLECPKCKSKNVVKKASSFAASGTAKPVGAAPAVNHAAHSCGGG